MAERTRQSHAFWWCLAGLTLISTFCALFNAQGYYFSDTVSPKRPTARHLFFLPRPDPQSQVSRPQLKTDKYTIVIPAFRRSDLLSTVLGHYCNFTDVDKIILVWNNVNEAPPHNMSKVLHCTRDVIMMPQRENLITNRFRPVQDIDTECELS